MFPLSIRLASGIKPVSLMRLTEIKDPNDILKDFEEDDIVVQFKYDGWKTQIIKDNGKVNLYSRRGVEVTDNFPEIVSALKDIPDKTFVEGELVYEHNGKQYVTKVTSLAGSSAEKAIEKAKELPGEIKVYLYDILWLKGKNVTDFPHSKRRELLESVIKSSKKIKLTKQYPFSKWKEVMKEAVESGGEGVVLKIKDQPYQYKKLGEQEPKPKGVMYKFKGGIGKSESDDFVVYDYEITDKGKLNALFGQYYKDKLYAISKIDNFSKEDEEEIKNKLKKGPFTTQIAFQERLPGGLRHQKIVQLVREDKDPKDATMDEFHVKYIDNFKVINDNISKKADIVDDVLGLLQKKYPKTSPAKYTELHAVPEVDVEKAYKIICTVESKCTYIVGDVGTAYGQTQSTFDNYVNLLAKNKNVKDIIGLSSSDLNGLAEVWNTFKKKMQDIPLWVQTNVDENAVKSFMKTNPSAVVRRREGTTIRYSPTSDPGVVKIRGGKYIGYVLNLPALKNLGLNTDSSMSSLRNLANQYITDGVIRNGIVSIFMAQEKPETYTKFKDTFSKKNVDSNPKIKELTDKVSQQDFMSRVNSVLSSLRQSTYNTTVQGAYNIYQLIAISNAAGTGAVQQFLLNKKPFSSAQTHYLQRANPVISKITGIQSDFPPNGGLAGFDKMSALNNMFKICLSSRENKPVEGALSFPGHYAEDIKSGKKKITIRSTDVPVQIEEIVKCITYSGTIICDIKIISKELMNVARIRKAFGKYMADSLEQKFGSDGRFAVIRFEKCNENNADDGDEKWEEVLIDKDGVKLTRQEIKDHFEKPEIRKKIMSRIKGKPILVYIGTGKNEKILKRNVDGKQIVITNDDPKKDEDPNNYFYWTKRRLLSVHEVFGKTTDLGFIDLDIHGDFPLAKAKKYAKELSKEIKSKYGKTPTIYESGGKGIHIEFYLKKTSIDKLRDELKDILNKINENWEGVTTGVVKGSGMRSDVSTLHDKGSLRVPWSLGETYGKVKEPVEQDSDDYNNDLFGRKHGQNVEFPPESGVIDLPPTLEAVPVDPYSYNDADDRIAFSIRDLRKIAGISDVREEWVWLWSSENKRLFTHLSIKDGKRQGLQDHIALARHYGIKAIKDKDYHGYVTFFKDPNKTTEILTYGDNFSNLDSEIQRAIVNKIFIGEPLAFTDIQLEWPGGEWKEYEFKPMTEVEAYEKILSIWKFADELEFEKIAKDPLSVYKKKRDFDETKEPEGKAEKENKYRFVIQLHKAKKAKDHFDLRLENDKGAMSSWAIPKHKMPKDKEKLLAISTEDHPISYMKFEGKIPEGSYGAGEVEIYDSGKYEEIEKTKSKIVFKLNGKKEKGTYTLLNTDGNKWIIFKSKE